MTHAILVENFIKIYPRTWKSSPFEAVKNISFSVGEGEVFGFIGPNGAGKSSTIKVLTGATTATSGKISIYGRDIKLPESRLGMGYVPENPSLPEYLTPLELLKLNLAINKVLTADSTAYCMGWLERFGLGHVANKLLRGFSKGMLQRTALAHSMAAKPRLLILDEPLSGLDPIGRRDVVDILAEFKQSGGSIFLTSHVLHDVERLADRFGLIHQGELKTIAQPTDLMGEEQIVTIRTTGIDIVEGLVSESGSYWSMKCKRTDIWQNLHHIESCGHTILEIKPTLNLESIFLKYIEQTERTESGSIHGKDI